MDFGTTYCINLPERTDRWENVQKEFPKLGTVTVNKFNAVKRTIGHEGCTASHLELLKLLSGIKRFTIFEDDLLISDDAITILNEVEKQLPEDWDMLYLGANLMKPVERFSENLYRIKGAFTTHAMVFNNSSIPGHILSHQEQIKKIDVFYYREIQENFKCFLCSPMVALQNDSFSNILRRTTDNSTAMTNNFKKYTNDNI
jgi:GR25 family glycosyltransferase involved in LPS biosynthesis